MTTIFVDASNLVKAGGMSVGVSLLSSLNNTISEDKYIFVVPDKLQYRSVPKHERVHVIFLSKIFDSRFIKYFKNGYVRKLINFHHPNFVFTLGNIPTKTIYKQFVLIQWPYIAYPNDLSWGRMTFLEKVSRRFKIHLIKSRLKYVTGVFVQTPIMRDRLNCYVSNCPPVYVVESSYQIPAKREPISKYSSLYSRDYLNLLCLTSYYSHKNVEILVEVAKLFKQNKQSIRVILTLEPNNDNVKRLIRAIGKYGLADHFVNIGTVKPEEVYNLMGISKAFILPTLLETVGLTYYEAMYSGLPIFTSDLDFAKGICGESAFYFDPYSAQDIHNVLISNIFNHQSLENKVQLGNEILINKKGWMEITKQYIEIIKSTRETAYPKS